MRLLVGSRKGELEMEIISLFYFYIRKLQALERFNDLWEKERNNEIIHLRFNLT